VLRWDYQQQGDATMATNDKNSVVPTPNEMALFIQYWTIERCKSMDDADDESIIAFVNGMRYACAFKEMQG
jgi:hypothetical protein